MLRSVLRDQTVAFLARAQLGLGELALGNIAHDGQQLRLIVNHHPSHAGFGGERRVDHHELAADLTFLRAIIYFGAQMKARGEYRWLDNYLDTIVALDPHWKTPYRWAGVAGTYPALTAAPLAWIAARASRGGGRAE